MKHCPQCKRTYSDDSLRFCLDDGSVLARDPNATLPYSPTTYDAVPPTEVLKSPAPSATLAISSSPRPESPGRAGATSNSSSPILTAGVISIAVLLLILTSVGVAFVYKYRKGPD